jgi:hypothetical protein
VKQATDECSLHKLTAAIAACSAGSSRLEFTQEMQGRWRWGALKEQTGVQNLRRQRSTDRLRRY